MVSKLRLCRAIQPARASASATVPIASTSTASYSPKIKVEVIGSKPSGSPKGFGRSPTMTFPGAVKTFTLSVFVATGAVTRVVSFSAFVPSIWHSFRRQASDCSKQNWQKWDDESVGRTYRSRPKYWLDTAARKASTEHPQPFKSESHPDRALTVLELGALSDLDNIPVRIADVAANLAVLGYRLRDELGSATFPQFIACLDIGNADIHKAVDVVRV